MNKIYKNLILFIYVSMFIITCDYRDPTGGDNNDSLNIDRLEISSDPIISIEDANSPYSAEIKVTPLDEDGNVSHYDVLFGHGLEKNVDASTLEVLEGMYHEHAINDEKNAVGGACPVPGPQGPLPVLRKQDHKVVPLICAPY